MATKKTAAKATKKTATTKTSGKAGPASKKALTPLEKARLARAGGKGGAKKARKGAVRPGQFVFEAPADFKPFFLEVAVKTEKDGLLGSAIKAIRYQGRYDPQAEDKKKFDIGAYDVPTLVGLASRLQTKTFKTNGQKLMPVSIKDRNVTEKVKKEDGTTRDKYTYGSGYRLPPNTAFYMLLRVGSSKAKGNILTVGIKQVQQLVKIDKNGVKKTVRKLLDKKDPAYRLLMSTKRYLPPAFKEVLLPPKRTRGANKKTAEADDE